ncbi:Predicted Zn-dependent peptidase [Ekhidna lutea]|uniref:Predicted Zn-dependent peptidase n=1 Tax=Ekhidna lutea TaxID=447679 RepID=A0A239IUQ7_EKHLU|nr:insulinase family protein [Ekhidna lutea]SNS96773.1 Predicted Zn-dependent peptidase [Ekhidna lutea]
MNFKNILSLVLTIGIVGAFAQVDRSKLPEAATPRPINIGEYESFELKNGLKVFIIENHKLPRVSYNLLVDREPLLEEDKVGYLGMVGQMMMRGTETRTKEQLDEEIDFIGASVFAGSTNVFASGLSKYQEKILELMTDVAFNPTFPEEELEKIRKQTLSGLASAKEDPGAIAGNLNQALVFGKNHPYGEIQTEETTNNITVEDLKAYHSTYFKPNISYLAIVGDVDPKQMKKMVKTYFGSWEEGEVPMPSYETPQAPEKTKVGIVNRSASVQSVINITYPVVLPVGSEDAIKVRVMNQILGGSFSGKLNMNLREDKGYTYGSRSSLSSDELVSRFNANADVRNEVTDSAVVQMIYEMEQMRNGEITEEELELAKNSISGSFSQSLERPQTVANFALNTAIYNLPEDYYNTYLQKVQAVTIEDVKAIAQKYLSTEKAHINIVGKASEVAEKLKQFGELTYYDTYGNEVDPSLSKLPEGLTAETVLKNYIEAIGGREKVEAVNSVKMKMEASIMGQSLNMESTRMAPNKMLMEVKMGGNVMQKQVFDGEKGASSGMQGSKKIEGNEALDMAISSSIVEETVYLDKNVDVKLTSVENIDGNDAYGLEVTMPSGKKSIRYYDTETGFLVRTTNTIEAPQGAMTLSTDYSDYKEYGGILFPTGIKQPMNAQMKMDIKVTEILVNEEIDESIFNVE